MRNKYGNGPSYCSPAHAVSSLPTPRFFAAMAAGPLLWLWRMARAGKLDDTVWVESSAWLANIFESVGGKLIVEGMDNLEAMREPCVFIANHMSTLETFILPGIIRPYMPVTFVVKESLNTMPVFGPIMRSRDPVTVGRINPREDLSTVLTEGEKRLKNGISIVVFPQSTRSASFDAEHFNSIGIKLALRANAPVIPIALKTDAWGTGKRIKELARINPSLPAHFHFGRPMRAAGRGKAEHAEICQFIGDRLEQWRREAGQI